ncbi:hypothetical protein Pse7367_1977 [Thalassoporum mexicanum PCC 7367]|nr:hypothetical protein Pse7367_1977 [Pseudanabaena sp. PCC 7367]
MKRLWQSRINLNDYVELTDLAREFLEIKEDLA